jgi:hypothetical protein
MKMPRVDEEELHLLPTVTELTIEIDSAVVLFPPMVCNTCADEQEAPSGHVRLGVDVIVLHHSRVPHLVHQSKWQGRIDADFESQQLEP